MQLGKQVWIYGAATFPENYIAILYNDLWIVMPRGHDNFINAVCMLHRRIRFWCSCKTSILAEQISDIISSEAEVTMLRTYVFRIHGEVPAE